MMMLLFFKSNSWTKFLAWQKNDLWNDLRPGNMVSMIAYVYIYIYAMKNFKTGTIVSSWLYSIAY